MTATGMERPPGVEARQLGELPSDRVLQLRGRAADTIATSLAHGNADLPAALTCRVLPTATPADLVTAILDDVESAAIELFPTWLPEAEHIRTPGGAGLVAVRALAADRASRSAHFRPFLSDLAAMALGGRAAARRRFPPEIRAVGLARVIADALRRDRLVLVVDVPSGLTAVDEQVVAAGCGWLADRGRFGVWLTGAPLVTVDWLASATLTVPLTGAVDVPFVQPGAVVGIPHPGSTAEAALEAALATRSWAAGRRWNQTYRSHALRSPVRLDLLWQDERCVVEIDGPEHCAPVRFDADRRRDVQLQLDGYAVLRFTNARVLHDVEAVVAQIGKFIEARRRESWKGTAWPTTT
jgi:very-short-patch-repair endonuclease